MDYDSQVRTALPELFAWVSTRWLLPFFTTGERRWNILIINERLCRSGLSWNTGNCGSLMLQGYWCLPLFVKDWVGWDGLFVCLWGFFLFVLMVCFHGLSTVFRGLHHAISLDHENLFQYWRLYFSICVQQADSLQMSSWIYRMSDVWQCLYRS